LVYSIPSGTENIKSRDTSAKEDFAGRAAVTSVGPKGGREWGNKGTVKIMEQNFNTPGGKVNYSEEDRGASGGG